MSGIAWVLPSIDPAYRQVCLGGMHQSVRDRTLVVDNTSHNRGVAASWNLGRARAISEGDDWLVLLSESVRFGEPGALDIEEELRADPGNTWVDFVGLGWHLVAFRTSTLRRVGEFDENFWPAYMEDSDYLIRLDRAGYPSPRENQLPHRWIAGCDVDDVGTEHALREGLVAVDFAYLVDYWQEKWGGPPPTAGWARPFDSLDRDWTWWPRRREAA